MSPSSHNPEKTDADNETAFRAQIIASIDIDAVDQNMKVTRSVFQAVWETYRKFQFASFLDLAIIEIRVLGKGSDVSPEQMAIEELAANSKSIAATRLAEIFHDAPKNTKKEKFLQQASKDKYFKRDDRGSWTLDYLIWWKLRKDSNLSPEVKNSLCEMRKLIWDITHTNEFEDLLTLRNKHISHLGRDRDLDTDQKIDEQLYRHHMEIFIDKMLDIYYNVVPMTGNYFNPTLNDLKKRAHEVFTGLTPLTDLYRKITKEPKELTRLTAPPTFEEAFLNPHIAAAWAGICGCEYTAELDEFGKRWLLTRRNTLLQETMLGTYRSLAHTYNAVEFDVSLSHKFYHQ